MYSSFLVIVLKTIYSLGMVEWRNQGEEES